MKKHNSICIILNFTVPILVGAIFYYLLSSDVIFVRLIDERIGGGLHFPSLLANGYVVKYVRFYLLDMLWSYALVFSLHYIWGNNTARLKWILGMAFIFSAGMELLQLTSFVKGTFDILDILFEVVEQRQKFLGDLADRYIW